MKPIASNKKVWFDYSITDNLEAGLVLTGEEIKAIRAGRVNISGSYVKPFIKDEANELWWVGSNFNIENGDQSRSKKLLLHKVEIERLTGKLSAKNLTIVPLELYLSRGRAKLKIGLASRKQTHDKREMLKKRAVEREVARRLNNRNQSP